MQMKQARWLSACLRCLFSEPSTSPPPVAVDYWFDFNVTVEHEERVGDIFQVFWVWGFGSWAPYIFVEILLKMKYGSVAVSQVQAYQMILYI